MLTEFKKFITRGNVVDMAVGVVMGGAFGHIITSLVNDVLMPPIGLLVGRVDFSRLYVNLSGTHYDSLSEAQKAGAATVNYGLFINTVIHFLIVSFCVFLLVRYVNRALHSLSLDTPAPATRECPFCLTKVPIRATRCAACTSELPPNAA